MSYLFGTGAILALAVAWLAPTTTLAGVLGWVSSLLLVYFSLFCRRAGYISFFMSGVFGVCLCFSWAWPTVADLSGLQDSYVTLIFLIFAIFTAAQFPLFLLVYRSLPRQLDQIGVRIPVAWSALEVMWPRIFDWRLGHTQFGSLHIIQLAELGGVTLISFTLLWISELLFRGLFIDRSKLRVIAAILLLLSVLVFGELRVRHYADVNFPVAKFALVQSKIGTNREVESVYDQRYITRFNWLRDLSNLYGYRADIVVWPETSLPKMYLDADPHLPSKILNSLKNSYPLLAGATTLDIDNKEHNSALLISSGGRISDYYNKQRLIPFGEYIPFRSWIPWAAIVHPDLTDLSAGVNAKVFEIDAQVSGQTIGVAPLICYEDTLPRIASQGVFNGAQVLVSISNNAWLPGHATTALMQHLALAGFRAVENRRSLVRVSSTGISSVITPTGVERYSIAPWEEGVVLADVPVVRGPDSTIFNALNSLFIPEILALFALAVALLRILRQLKARLIKI